MKLHTYKIYQISSIHAIRVRQGFVQSKVKQFCSLQESVTSISLSAEGYQLVYEGEHVSDKGAYGVLDELFRIFNIDHPKDFKAHSLSVSDLVELDGEFYFCDRFGWRKLEVTA